jgi:hypothetical protein
MCSTSIPGRLDSAFRRQITDHPYVPRRCQKVREVLNRKLHERAISGFPRAAAKEVNARCNDQATGGNQRGCADSAFLPAASIRMQNAWPSVEVPGWSKLGAPQTP